MQAVKRIRKAWERQPAGQRDGLSTHGLKSREASPWPVTHLSLESEGHCHRAEVWEALWDAVMLSGINILLGHMAQTL